MKEIIFRARGGIGNQLFQFAFCFIYNKKALRLLRVDAISGFEKDRYRRSFKLNSIGCNIPVLSRYRSYFYLILYKLITKLKLKLSSFEVIDSKSDFINNAFESSSILYTEDLYQDLALTCSRDSDIKDYINKSWQVNEVDENLLASIKEDGSVAIHVRRKDYDSTLPISFYLDAIKLVQTKVAYPVYYIFSDDISWCKNSFKGIQRVNYINYNDELVELFLMKSCSNFIIANSTYSWWAAILSSNEEKIIVSPPKQFWFKEELCLEEFEIMPIHDGNN